MQNNFLAIPEELRLINQWVCWRYEDVGARKATKVPYSPISGKHADVNKPDTWGTFEEAFNTLNVGSYSGLGFVFTEDDPYTFIDLDDTEGNQVDFERQLKIFKEFDSYSEVSPSGKGLHIIIKGNVPSGRRRSHIEIYSSQRYATMTGNVHNIKPIADRQELLSQLWEQMGGTVNNIVYDGNSPEIATDQEILTRALDAINGDKFEKLLSGKWQDLYTSQSEADIAFIDIVSFYTQNKIQIARIFRASPLGQRDKAKRVDYVDRMILKSFDKMLPPIDFEGMNNALNAHLANKKFAEINAGVVQIVEPAAHNSQVAGASPVTGTKLNEGYYAKQGSGKETFIQQETLSTEQEILSRSQHEEAQRSEGMVSELQKNSEMRNMPGNSYINTGFSSQRPITERGTIGTNGDVGLVQGKNNEGNKQVHGSVRQLSQENSLYRERIEINTTNNTAGSSSGKTAPFEGVNSGSSPLPAAIRVPPGLMGQLAQFIYSAAPRPVPEIALAGAIGLMAGICGKAYNVSNTGLNQYILLLAKTGMGKEGMAQGIDKLMSAVAMQVPTAHEFIGPSYIASGQALVKYVHKKSQCFVSILGEFGLRLQGMSSQSASAHEKMLKQILLELYNKSGHSDVYRASIHADFEKNTDVTKGPAFSLLGESNPHSFYSALSEDMIAEGLLPRFLMIEYTGNRPDLNKQYQTINPPIPLVEQLATIAANCKNLMHNQKIIHVQLDQDAMKLSDEFDTYATQRINQTQNEVILQLWNRAHLKALKLAALVAVGIHPYEPVITQEHIVWAIEMVQRDIINLTQKFEIGEVGTSTSENKQISEVTRMIKEYLTKPWDEIKRYVNATDNNHIKRMMYDNRIIPYAYISKRVMLLAAFKNDRLGATNAIKRTIQVLVESDKLREMGKTDLITRFGTTQRAFIVSDLDLLG